MNVSFPFSHRLRLLMNAKRQTISEYYLVKFNSSDREYTYVVACQAELYLPDQNYFTMTNKLIAFAISPAPQGQCKP